VRHVGGRGGLRGGIGTRRTADEALRLIRVDYEVLPAVLSPEDALDHPEIKVNERAKVGNITKHVQLQFGEVDEAVFLGRGPWCARRTGTRGSTHTPIEPHCAVARAWTRTAT